MKKIYLLMSAALVALTSVAAPKAEKIQLNADAVFEMEQVKYEQTLAIENGEVAPTRSWTDANGTVWNAFMINTAGLWTMVGDGTLTAADFPAYWVTCNITSLNADGTGYNHYLTLDLCWPANVCWFYDETMNGGKGGYNVDECAATVGADNVYNISPIDWFNDQTVFEMVDQGYVNTLGILHPGTTGTTCMYNGEDGYTLTEDTTVAFNNFDSELSWLDIILTGKIEGSGMKTISMNYSGEASLLGMVAGKSNTVEVGEVHVFDCGDIDYDNDWAFVYVEEFEPVRRYHVAFSSKDFAYYNPETGGAYNDVYTSTELPTGPGAFVNEGAEYFAFWGAFFAAEGSEKPYGKWTNPNFWKQDETGNVITTPKAYELILGGYNLDISQQDGTWAVYGDFYRSPAQNTAEMVIGDKNEGMLFVWDDNFGEAWTAAYKGDIYFHNNPEDFLAFEMLPSVGTEEFTSIEKVEAADLNVKVVGNSIIAPEGAEVYNLNGVRVNANDLQNGLYIVKVGKNAVKVVL